MQNGNVKTEKKGRLYTRKEYEKKNEIFEFVSGDELDGLSKTFSLSLIKKKTKQF